MFDSGNQAESAEALRLRYGAQTANLATVALVTGAMLEESLRHAGRFMGLGPDVVNNIVVKPNMRFIENDMTPSDAEGYVRLWQQGAISKRTMHENLQRGGIASPERTLEEEGALIESEMPFEPEPEPGADEPLEE
jgi:hypothetical protein